MQCVWFRSSESEQQCRGEVSTGNGGLVRLRWSTAAAALGRHAHAHTRAGCALYNGTQFSPVDGESEQLRG